VDQANAYYRELVELIEGQEGETYDQIRDFLRQIADLLNEDEGDPDKKPD